MDYIKACRSIETLSNHVDPNTNLGRDIISKAYDCRKILISKKMFKNESDRFLYSSRRSFYKTAKMMIAALVTAFSLSLAYRMRDPITYLFSLILTELFNYPPIKMWDGDIQGDGFFPWELYLVEFVFYIFMIMTFVGIAVLIEKKYLKIKASSEIKQLIYLSNVKKFTY